MPLAPPLRCREKAPDLSRLQHTGVQITTALSRCRAIFADLIVLAPQSAPVMREYAGFLMELANDPRKAAELLTDAEQIEDERSRALSAQSRDVDVSFGAFILRVLLQIAVFESVDLLYMYPACCRCTH